jgi:hypothetical protein
MEVYIVIAVNASGPTKCNSVDRGKLLRINPKDALKLEQLRDVGTFRERHWRNLERSHEVI